MIEIYTPKEWNSIFSGHPTICIESSGNIYSGNEAYKFGRTAIGYVNWSEGKIYGPDFNSIGAKPIARVLDKDGTKLIYKNSDIGFDGRAFPFAKPLFYIKNGKVYDHDPNSTIFDDAQGYVRSDSTGNSTSSSGGSGVSSGSGNSGGGSSGGGGGGLPGCGLLYVILPFVAIFLIFGVIPENITSITVGIGAIALAITVVLGLIKGFSFTFKRIVEGVLYGGVSFFGFSLFWFIFSGIRANFGSGGGYDENIGLVLLPLAVFVLCLVDFEGENKAKKAEKASTQNRQTPPNYTQNKQTQSSYTQNKQTQSSYTQPKQNQTTYQTQANRTQSTGSGKYRITCQRCGKEFLSNNASAEICDFCKEFIRKKQNSAASQTSSNYRTCMRCGKQFYAEAANAKYCSICESITAAEKKQAAQQKLVFDIFICPKCGTKNRGPRGKILTCGNPNCRSKFRTEA